MLMSALFFKERITAVKLAALAMAFGGCVLVSGISGGGLSLAALLCGLGAGLGYALYSILGTVALREHEPLTVTFYGFLFGALSLALVVQPWNGFGFAATPVNLLVAAGFGLIPTACGYGMYYKGVIFVRDKAMAPVISSIENIVACLLGFLVLSEYFNLWKAAGIAMVFLSILMIARAGKTA